MIGCPAEKSEPDQWFGLLAEDRMPDAAVGPTLTLIIADQFERLMVGDRFFFAWDDDLSADEVEWLLSTSLSDIILRNTDIESLQSNVFFVPEPGGSVPIVFGLMLIAVLGRSRKSTT